MFDPSSSPPPPLPPPPLPPHDTEEAPPLPPEDAPPLPPEDSFSSGSNGFHAEAQPPLPPDNHSHEFTNGGQPPLPNEPAPPLPPSDANASIARSSDTISEWFSAEEVIGLGFTRPIQRGDNDGQQNTHTPIGPECRGYKLLKKLGWEDGQGLGKLKQGIVVPITLKEESTGLGLGKAAEYDRNTTEATKNRKLLSSEVVETQEETMKRLSEGARLDQIKADVKDMNKMFYCQDCDKQYKTVKEFENHLSSYDHHHVKRLRDMQRADKARKGGGAGGIDRTKEQRREMEEMQRRAAAAAHMEASKAGLVGQPPLPPLPPAEGVKLAPAESRVAVKFGLGLKKPKKR